jgi:hypothetical protein
MKSIDKPLSKNEVSRLGDFESVERSIKDLLRQPDYDDGSVGPVLVRLAWYVCTKLGNYQLMANTIQGTLLARMM